MKIESPLKVIYEALPIKSPFLYIGLFSIFTVLAIYLLYAYKKAGLHENLLVSLFYGKFLLVTYTCFSLTLLFREVDSERLDKYFLAIPISIWGLEKGTVAKIRTLLRYFRIIVIYKCLLVLASFVCVVVMILLT